MVLELLRKEIKGISWHLLVVVEGLGLKGIVEIFVEIWRELRKKKLRGRRRGEVKEFL